MAVHGAHALFEQRDRSKQPLELRIDSRDCRADLTAHGLQAAAQLLDVRRLLPLYSSHVPMNLVALAKVRVVRVYRLVVLAR